MKSINNVRGLPGSVNNYVVVPAETPHGLYGSLPHERVKKVHYPEIKRRPPPQKKPIKDSKPMQRYAAEKSGRVEKKLSTVIHYERRLRKLSSNIKKERLPEGLKTATDLLTDRLVELCERKLKLQHKSVRKSGRRLVKKLRSMELEGDKQFEIAKVQFDQGLCETAVQTARESKQLYSECGFHLVKNAKWFRVMSFIQQLEMLQKTSFNAICIQKTYRGYSARKKIKRVRKRQNSAIAIQRVVRGKLGRERYKRVKKDVSARRIQCQVRRYQARTLVHKKKLCKEGKDERLAVEIGISGLLGISFTDITATLEFADGKHLLLSQDAHHLSLLPGNNQYGIPVAILYNVYQGDDVVATGKLRCRKAFLHDMSETTRLPLVGSKYSKASMDVEIQSCSFEYYKSDPVFRQRGLLSKSFRTLRSQKTKRAALDKDTDLEVDYEEEEEAALASTLSVNEKSQEARRVSDSRPDSAVEESTKRARLSILSASGLAKADFLGKRYV